MGNHCFGRVDEHESPQESNSRPVVSINESSDISHNNSNNNGSRIRQTSLRHRNLIHECYLPQYDNDPIFHPAPGVSCPMSQLTEEEQIMIAKRLGLLNTLPMFIFDDSKKEKFTECIICMCDYIEGEECRHLPCLHTFHRKCIDDWLIRSFTCPSCLEQVDNVLLSTQGSIKTKTMEMSSAMTQSVNLDTTNTQSSRKHRKRRTVSNVESLNEIQASIRVARHHSRLSQKSASKVEPRSALSSTSSQQVSLGGGDCGGNSINMALNTNNSSSYTDNSASATGNINQTSQSNDDANSASALLVND